MLQREVLQLGVLHLLHLQLGQLDLLPLLMYCRRRLQRRMLQLWACASRPIAREPVARIAMRASHLDLPLHVKQLSLPHLRSPLHAFRPVEALHESGACRLSERLQPLLRHLATRLPSIYLRAQLHVCVDGRGDIGVASLLFASVLCAPGAIVTRAACAVQCCLPRRPRLLVPVPQNASPAGSALAAVCVKRVVDLSCGWFSRGGGVLWRGGSLLWLWRRDHHARGIHHHLRILCGYPLFEATEKLVELALSVKLAVGRLAFEDLANGGSAAVWHWTASRASHAPSSSQIGKCARCEMFQFTVHSSKGPSRPDTQPPARSRCTGPEATFRGRRIRTEFTETNT